MKEDILKVSDKELISKMKEDIKQSIKVFKFKNSKNKGALKSQKLEIFNYSKKRMKTKKNFSIQTGNTLIRYLYIPKKDDYNIHFCNLRLVASNGWGR